MTELQSYGDERTKTTLMKHGAKEPFFGVKVQDLKKILKKTKKNHALSLDLYKTGNSDAMYLAGLMADENQITKQQLNSWVKKAYWSYLNEYTVPFVASETKFGFDLGMEWIESKNEDILAAGWATLASYSSVWDDEEIDIKKYSSLLDEVEANIHQAPNRVKYTMNRFVITVGTSIKALTTKAKKVAKKVGKVEVHMGGTACKVPLATEHIEKIEARNKIGVKRKTARC
jgi:hypothetical protein